MVQDLRDPSADSLASSNSWSVFLSFLGKPLMKVLRLLVLAIDHAKIPRQIPLLLISRSGATRKETYAIEIAHIESISEECRH